MEDRSNLSPIDLLNCCDRGLASLASLFLSESGATVVAKTSTKIGFPGSWCAFDAPPRFSRFALVNFNSLSIGSLSLLSIERNGTNCLRCLVVRCRASPLAFGKVFRINSLLSRIVLLKSSWFSSSLKISQDYANCLADFSIDFGPSFVLSS